MRACLYLWLCWYLKILAKLQLKKQKLTIIGVTGSVGKTSCMMAIKAVLEDDFKVKASIKANSEVGIPLDVLGFKVRNYKIFDWFWIIPLAFLKLLTNFKKYDIYIVEMAIDSPNPPKNMEWLLSILKPNIGLFLNVFPVHCEAFESLNKKPIDSIGLEKGKLITSLPKNGWAILNSNDKRVISFKNKTKAKVITFNNSNYLQECSLKVGKIFGINKNKALKKIKKNFKMPKGRMEIIKGIKNTTLIDSSYNASRESMLLGLRRLTGSGPVSRKIAVLGDMRELGREAKKEHEAVAEKAVKIAQIIVTVGPLMKKYFLPKAISLGFDKENLFWFENTFKALKALKTKIIVGGEIILIKASQNTLLFEIIVEGLMKNPEKAKDLLCRRGKFWDKKRQAIKKKAGTI